MVATVQHESQQRHGMKKPTAAWDQMTDVETFDLIVIGAGPGGSSCAEMLNNAGLRVALVEKNALGGECLNYGCDPSKTMLFIAKLLHHAQMATDYGAAVQFDSIDWPAVGARVNEVQRQMRGGTEAEAVAAMCERGITLFCETATFIDEHHLRVGERVIAGEHILIATGAQSTIPPIPGLDQVAYHTNRSILSVETLPNSMAVIGGGPVGVEFAQLFQRFGVQVTLVEESSQLLPKDDLDVAKALAEVLTAEGITLRLNTQLQRVERRDGETELTLVDDANGASTLRCELLLLAVGRSPTVAGLNLDAAGIAVRDGAIEVDEQLCTTVKHIYAVGDVTGGYPFTHVANAQGRHVAQSILNQQQSRFDDRAIPWVTYVAPEAAHVGLTERQAQEQGIEYQVDQVAFADIPRAQATGNTAGLVKFVVAADGQILGCHILGEGAGELIAPVLIAMRNRLPVQALQDVILPYPTMAEALKQVAGKFASS